MTILKKHLFFIALSILIACIDSAFVYLTYTQAKAQLHAEEQQQAINYFSAFEIAYKAAQKNMLQISNIVANDLRYIQLFLDGKRAVESEGGGAGGIRAQRARDELNSAVKTNWQQFTDKFQARQLHFHLGPGSTSFLRVHKPHKFGDNMDDVRQTIVYSNKYQQQISGFETGRLYSGIRGVAPVFSMSEFGEREHIGAVEAGISFSPVLENLTTVLKVNAAVLLYEDHLRQSVWPEYLKTRLELSPSVNGLVMEATTSEQINQLRALSAHYYSTNIHGTNIDVQVLVLEGRDYLYAVQPLRDFIGSENSAIPDAGQIVVWQDITSLYEVFNNNFRVTVYSALIAFLIVELLVFLTIRVVSRRLQSIIDKQTGDILFRAMALDSSPDFIAITDMTGKIEYVNSKAKQTTGYSSEELLGKNMSILRSGHTKNDEYQRLWSTILAGKEWRGEFLNKSKGGTLYWAENVISPKRDSNGAVVNYIVAQHDVTARHHHHEEVLHDALHDQLTGLINRRAFEQRMNRIFSAMQISDSSTVLIFLDLDHFKRINDECGHQAGDQVLKDISNLMEGRLRQRDTLARLGGDEFVIIMENCEIEQAMLVSGKICAAIKAYEFNWKNRIYSLGVSIGVTPFLMTDSNWEEVIDRADKACYDAKETGRSRVVLGETVRHK